MAVKYSGLLKFTDEIKAGINLAADGTVEKAVLIDGDGVETPIGGGTSDYTTATLTLTNNFIETVAFAVPIISADPGASNYSDAVVSVEASATETVTVVMYKGEAICRVIDRVDATATGNISGSAPDFHIHGNGAITATDRE